MSRSIAASISRAAVLREYFVKPFLRVNRAAWKRLPSPLRDLRPVCAYGGFLHSLVLYTSERRQNHGTRFFRNRPELELIRVLVSHKPIGEALNIAVLACSNGAEVYSIVWTIRSARPDLKLNVHAIDISDRILEFARKGVYSLGDMALNQGPIFERMTDDEMTALFDKEDGSVRIKPWIGRGIHWEKGDAADPHLAERLGPQDIVVANKFLCHMAPRDSERCLRNLAQLVEPGGYLSVSGIDLDIRTKVALDMGWTPVLDSIEEIHNGDPTVRRDWPWWYWGLEPFDSHRPDWPTRYAAVFQLGSR